MPRTPQGWKGSGSSRDLRHHICLFCAVNKGSGLPYKSCIYDWREGHEPLLSDTRLPTKVESTERLEFPWVEDVAAVEDFCNAFLVILAGSNFDAGPWPCGVL